MNLFITRKREPRRDKIHCSLRKIISKRQNDRAASIQSLSRADLIGEIRAFSGSDRRNGIAGLRSKWGPQGRNLASLLTHKIFWVPEPLQQLVK